MEKLVIKQKDNTIAVVLDKKNNIFKFEGRSLPENTLRFFEPVIHWLEEYRKNPAEKTYIDMNFIYFNTSSAKVILEILEQFDEIYKSGKDVKLKWHYLEGDIDIKEAGEEYEGMLSLPFEYVEIPDQEDE